MEHSSITLEQLENLLNVLDKNGSNSFVRVSDNNKTEIKKVLYLQPQKDFFASSLKILK